MFVKLPAVSHICSNTCLPFTSNYFYLYSTPNVVKKLGVNLSSVNRFRMDDLPTPESPNINNFTLFLALIVLDYIFLYLFFLKKNTHNTKNTNICSGLLWFGFDDGRMQLKLLHWWLNWDVLPSTKFRSAIVTARLDLHFERANVVSSNWFKKSFPTSHRSYHTKSKLAPLWNPTRGTRIDL